MADSPGTRYRLVYSTGGDAESVSSVILSAREAVHSLEIEAALFRQAGWVVREGGTYIIARLPRQGVIHVVHIRSFGPHDDLSDLPEWQGPDLTGTA